jgi:acetoin utilization deacetylase AcuC-like enzyme
MQDSIPVFYRPEQSCTEANSYSPSAGKPAQVMADWLAHPVISKYITVETFTPVPDDVMSIAHDPSYVRDIMGGKINNGFDNRNPNIAASLRYTVGSILAACKHVLTNGRVNFNYACSLTSGFHHAGYDFGGGFCTLNGLMIAAMRVQELGLAKRILILDMDQHYGNGTNDIIKRLDVQGIDHVTAEKSYSDADGAMEASKYLRSWPANHYDLVIYQAGADIHVDDPLGGLLTTEQMQRRDHNVFRSCSSRMTPIVWNLAGGYQRDRQGTIEPVLALHGQTMLACFANAGGIQL